MLYFTKIYALSIDFHFEWKSMGMAKLNLRKFKTAIFVNSVVYQNKLSIYTNSNNVFI